MATELQKHRNPKTVQPNMHRLSGTITIGGAGAISAQSGQRNGGVTFALNTTGRYDGTIHRGYRRWMSGHANLIGATAGTPPTPAKLAYITGVTAGGVAGTSGTLTFTIQCTAADGATATAPQSGDIISWEAFVSDSP